MEHQKWLEEKGYMLRPRYRPGWVPSWENGKDDEKQDKRDEAEDRSVFNQVRFYLMCGSSLTMCTDCRYHGRDSNLRQRVGLDEANGERP